MRRSLAASLAVAGPIAASSVAGTSDAAVQLAGQSRSVHAESTGRADLWAEGSNPVFPTQSFLDTDADDASASGFGVFDESVASAAPDVLIFPLTGSGVVSQTSSLSTATISASASANMATDSYWLTAPQLAIVNQQLAPPTYAWGYEQDESEGEAHFSVAFDVSAPMPYTITGSLGVSAVQTILGLSQANGSIELRHAQGGSVAQIAIDQYEFCEDQGGETTCLPGSRPLSAQGVLAPGSYVLEARATSSATSLCVAIHALICVDVSTSAEFGLELTFGEPLVVPGLGPASAGALALALAAAARRALRRPHTRAEI